MAKKKRKLSNKEIAAKLRKAKVVEKDLSEVKKDSDKKFRKGAEKQGLTTISSLNSEVRLHTKEAKGKPGDIQNQKNKIKAFTNENKKIEAKISKIKKGYKRASTAKKREITKQVSYLQREKKDIAKEKNLLNYYEGKDFDYIVNDGFKKFKINTKQLKKSWKKGEDISLPILREMEKDTKEAIQHYTKLINKEKKTATKARMKKLNRIKKGLEDKLDHVVTQNIKAIETGDMSELDEYNEKGEKAYSLLFNVVGFSIDRIGI